MMHLPRRPGGRVVESWQPRSCLQRWLTKSKVSLGQPAMPHELLSNLHTQQNVTTVEGETQNEIIGYLWL